MRQHNLKVTGSLQINGESVVSASQIVGLESASIHNGNWTASVENNEFKVVNGGSNLLYITSGSTEINNGTVTITADSFASDYAEDYTELGDALLLKGNGVVSGSFRPATGGIHDLGSITHPWKELFVSTGSINLVENGNVAFTITADTIVTTDTLTSGTIDLTKSLPTGVVSGSSQITFSGISSLPTLVSSSSQITYANISSIPVGIVSGSAQVIEIISPLNSYTSSVKNAISVIGEGTSSITTIYGNLVVEGTTLTVSASNLAIADNMIYLNDGNEITDPDLGIAGNYNDGTYSHAGIFSDASDSHTWKVYKGYTPEPSQSIDITHGSFSLADFQAATLKGSIAATNGVVSGSSQVIGILSSLNTYTGSNDTKWSTLLNVTSSLIARTGSLATTGSNTFFANQIVSGNVVITGSLGIGAPANEKFGVTGATGSQGFFRWTDGVTTSAFLGISGTTSFIHANNNTLGLGANGSNNYSPTMVINNGSVGIGITSPISQLHVRTLVATGDRPTNLATSATKSAVYFTTIAGSSAGMAFGQIGANTNYIQATYENGSSSTPLSLNPYGGKVGIGTDSPDNGYQGLTIFGTDPSLRLKTSSSSGWVWTEYVTSAGTNNFSMGVNQTAPYFAIRAGAGLDNPQFRMDTSGKIGMNTNPSTNSQLNVGGSLRVNRSIYNWFQVGTNSWDGFQYLHLKTNMSSGTNGNVDHTMSLFTGRLYSYSSAYIREGSFGFHNWSGVIYNPILTGNFWAGGYSSSDGFVVLIVALGGGSYHGVNIDWHQSYPYEFRDRIVTSYNHSNSSSALY